MVTVRLDVGVFWASSAEETLSVYAEAVKAERVGVGCCCQISDMVTNPIIVFFLHKNPKIGHSLKAHSSIPFPSFEMKG